MATDHIRYDVLARDALRGVLRRVLTDAAEHGLPGEHHFFITFFSTAAGELSPRFWRNTGEMRSPHFSSGPGVTEDVSSRFVGGIRAVGSVRGDQEFIDTRSSSDCN